MPSELTNHKRKEKLRKVTSCLGQVIGARDLQKIKREINQNFLAKNSLAKGKHNRSFYW
jgi:hypothetical protein